MQNNTVQKENKSILIYFIRHAESENNALQAANMSTYRTVRLQDPKLTDRGFVQTEACISYLQKKSITPTKVFCSLNSRALQTADMFQKSFNCEVETKQHICEQGYVYNWVNGEVVTEKGPGLTELKQQWPTFQMDPNVKEDGWNERTTQETKQELNERAKELVDFIKELVKNSIDQDLPHKQYTFITHGLFLDSILGVIFERNQDSVYKFNSKMQNTGISCFEVTYTGVVNMKYLNDFNHLQDWCLDPEIKQKAEQVGGINPEVKVKQMK